MDLRIDKLNRMVVGIATGNVSLTDLAAVAEKLIHERMLNYSKLFDFKDIDGTTVEKVELDALAKLLHETQPEVRRGPLAIVTHPARGVFARYFAELEVCGRPSKVFTNLHEARRWLDEQVAGVWVPLHRQPSVLVR